MQKVDLALSKKNNVVLFNIFALNIFFRLPSITNSTGIYIFIDEKLYLDETMNLIQNKSLILSFFKSGQLNIFPIAFFFILLEHITEIEITNQFVLIFSRIFFNIFLNSIVYIFIIKIDKLLSFYLFKKASNGITLSLFFFFNPYLFSNSRIWYANSYLYLATIITFYYILKIYFENINKKDTFKLVLSLAIGVSIKYNYIFLLTLVFFIYLSKLISDKKPYFFEIIFGLSLLVFFIAILNYSIFFNFENFVNDITFNSKNYDGSIFFNRDLNTAEKDFLLRILYHFLFLYFVPITIAGIFFYFYSLFIYLKLKNYLLLNLFSLAPLIYVIFISSFPKIFLNRNINFLIPIIIISAFVGFESIRYSISIKKFFAIFYFLIFISIFYDDLLPDSRLQSQNWIEENLTSENLTIGYNAGYTESSAKVLENAVNDGNFEQELDIYVIDDHWQNGFVNAESRQNILFVLNHKNSHYYYDSNYSFLNKNIYRTTENFDIVNYKLLKRFSSNGPNVYILKKTK